MVYKNNEIYEEKHKVRVIEKLESIPEFKHKESRQKKKTAELYSKILGFMDLYRDAISYEHPYRYPTADAYIPWAIPSSHVFNNGGMNIVQSGMFNGIITDSVPADFPGEDGAQYIYYVKYNPV